MIDLKGPILRGIWPLARALKQTKFSVGGSSLLPFLPTLSTDYLVYQYCPKESVCDFGLRRPFYSRQLF